MEELEAPPAAGQSDRIIEMARLWIDADKGVSHLSLNYGIFEEHELEIWGSLAADLLAHAVNAYLTNGGGATTAEAFALAEKGLRERLADNPTLAGVFGGVTLS